MVKSELDETGGAIGGLVDLIPLIFERQTQSEPYGVVILDEKQRFHSEQSATARCPIRADPRTTVLLHKSHIHRMIPSQPSSTISAVHAAPVGYLPPPGVPPAAVKPSDRQD